MKIGVLSVQGAFIEHENVLNNLGVECFEIRQKSHMKNEIDGIILPGGESTVMKKLLYELDIFDDIKKKILIGIPVMGTCAGAILLAEKIEDQDDTCFGTIPMTIKRNAYGRQIGSFAIDHEIENIGVFPMRFIRAPYISYVDPKIKILSKVDNKIVGVEYENQIALSFHPELTKDNRIHKYFLDKCYKFKSK